MIARSNEDAGKTTTLKKVKIHNDNGFIILKSTRKSESTQTMLQRKKKQF